MQVGDWVVFGIVVGIPLCPIWWRHDLIVGVVRLAIQIFVAVPSDAASRHVIRSILRVQLDRIGEGVIEERVGNKTAWIDGLAVDQPQRIAVASFDRGVALVVTLELVQVKGLDISTVVLIEFGQAVVHEYWRADVVCDLELQTALGESSSVAVDCPFRLVAPPLCTLTSRVVRWLEVAADLPAFNVAPFVRRCCVEAV